MCRFAIHFYGMRSKQRQGSIVAWRAIYRSSQEGILSCIGWQDPSTAALGKSKRHESSPIVAVILHASGAPKVAGLLLGILLVEFMLAVLGTRYGVSRVLCRFAYLMTAQ